MLQKVSFASFLFLSRFRKTFEIARFCSDENTFKLCNQLLQKQKHRTMMLTKFIPKRLIHTTTPSLLAKMTNQNVLANNNFMQQEIEKFRSSDADLQNEASFDDKNADEEHSSPNVGSSIGSSTKTTSHPYHFVPLTMGGGGRTHVVSEDSRQLIENEVSLDQLQTMTELFYSHAFQDPTLDKFIRNHDDPHGARFAKWIHQKLSGSSVWDEERRTRDRTPVTLAHGIRHVVLDRSSAHAGAWYSPKRPADEVGRHFQLDECRVWMRLHFWALRESGLMEKSPSFADYYARFIAHFVRVYESTAPQFARDSLRWSADPKNIETYIQNGRVMSDVLGLSLDEAEEQIPEDEANDFVWPYNQVAPEQ